MSVYESTDLRDYEWIGHNANHSVHLYPDGDGYFWVTVIPKAHREEGATTWDELIPRRDILWRIQQAGVEIREIWRLTWIDCGSPGYRKYYPVHPARKWEQDAETRRLREATKIAGPVVYFIRAESSGLIKIGKANNPVSRLKAIQTGSTEKLTLIAYTPGSHAEEKALHRRFASRRRHGEWFEPDDELLDVIKHATAALR